MSKLIAECIGTFAIVFFGTGAIIIDQEYGGVITHPGIACVFGFIVMAMIYSFGEVSGAHFNPAVTIAFSVAGLFPVKKIFPYVTAQVVGAILASLVLKILFPESQLLGATLPAGSALQSFVLETILTFFLMLVILQVSQGAKETGVMAGMAIGAVVLLEAMFGGAVSGASMNPARSIGPAVVSGNVQSLWLYLMAPAVGAIAASLIYNYGFRSVKP